MNAELEDPEIIEITEKINHNDLQNATQPDGTAVINGYNITDLKIVGKKYWFEYHCWENPNSADASIWYRSHQQVTVLKIVGDPIAFTSMDARNFQGYPLTYRAKFDDGLEWEFFEDELLDSKDDFHRPDPPLPPNA